jgi:SNF2 family DNA or RNA helicase
VKLWPHQNRAKVEALTYPKRMLAFCPRLGKTLAAIECIKAWGVHRGIVVAPLSVCPYWSEQLHREGYTVIDAWRGPTLLRTSFRGEAVVVINYDRLARLEASVPLSVDFLIGDESHRLAGPQTKWAKAFRRLAWNTKYVRLLTGTPITNNYGSLWGQMTCVDPVQWEKSYGKFANRHLVRHPIYPSTIIGYKDLPRIERLMSEGAHTVRREDVFGPDQYQYIRRALSLPSAANTLYRLLAKEWVLTSPVLTAEHVLKRLVRLSQFTSGYLPDDAGEIHEVHAAKVDAVMADLEAIVGAGEKVILFHRFTWEGRRYEAEIQKRYPGVPVYRIAGGVSSDDRATAILTVADHDGSVVVIAQEQAAGVGISFAKATHVMFVSSSYSFVGRKQAQDRVYSPGLRRVVYDYVMEGTIDVAVEKAIANKQGLHDSLKNCDLTSLVFGKQ